MEILPEYQVEIPPKCEVCGARGCKTEHGPRKKLKVNKTVYQSKEFIKWLKDADGNLQLDTQKSEETLKEIESSRQKVAREGLDSIENSIYNESE